MNEASTIAPDKVSKKKVKKVVYEKLESALAEYKTGISEKKFRNKLNC